MNTTRVKGIKGLNQNTATVVKCILTEIAKHCEQPALLTSDVEIDESFLGGRRVSEKKKRLTEKTNAPYDMNRSITP